MARNEAQSDRQPLLAVRSEEALRAGIVAHFHGGAEDDRYPVGHDINPELCLECPDLARALIESDVVQVVEVTAELGWKEGHLHRQRRDWDDGCRCAAWDESECGCGRYGSGKLLSLADNPYDGHTRKAKTDGE